MGLAVRVSPVSLLALGVACVALVGAAWLSRRKQRQQPPTKWRRVGKLAAITLYPLKSGRGISLQEGECTETGLAEPIRDGVLRLRDRCLAVYDAKLGQFVTGRKLARLLLTEIKADGPNAVVLSISGGEPIRVELPMQKTNLRQITMFKNEAIWIADCGDEAAEWVSKYVAQKPSDLRLGYDLDTEVGRRTVDSGPLNIYKRVYPNLTSKDLGMYSDFASFMLMTEASVEDMRAKCPPTVAPKITIRQFRPTFVVSDTIPYEEDTWEWVRIGENVILRDVKPCTRCFLTTFHPDAAERFPDMEPLKTLKGYRKVTKKAEKNIEGEAPVLGRYLGLRQGGTVKIGDDIFAPA